MLSIELFDSKYEKKLHEGAVDQLEQHRIDVLNDRMQELLSRAKESRYKNDPAALDSLKQQYQKIKDERDSYYKVRESQQGTDVVDVKQKMKALTPAKPGVAGAVKDVAQGLKNFLQGKPETGPTYESQKKSSDKVAEQSNPEDNDWDDADEFGMPGSEFFPDDDRLRDGDYVRDSQDGEYGEIFRMSGDPSERRVRILDRDGRGWYISPERLEPVDRNDPDIQRYFGKRRQRDMDEGWSDAVVARRTGQPRTPYSIYIKGKKWKDFENDDHAEAVANKLRAKFKADGRDPETITIAPTDYDQPIKEEQDTSAVESAIIRRIMVAHTDLLQKYGPQKVMQAAEEVAYNVGDVDEIGSSDVSAYVAQVEQILGATQELDEKWSAKYKRSINCNNPKGFSQRAHCQGRKK